MKFPVRHAGLALAVAVAAAAGCRSPGSGRPPLRIGVVADSAPLVFRHQGQWRGVEADLGRAFADRLAMKPVFVACPPDQLVATLLAGKVDVLMAGVAATEERRLQIDFATPYLVVGQSALVRTEDLPRCNTAIKIRMSQARVGVVPGSPGDGFVSGYFPGAGRTGFPGAAEAVAALLERRIDMFVTDAPAAWWLALQYPERLAVAPALFARQEIAWGFRRGSIVLRESANRALADWQKDGTLEAVLQRWIPYSK